MELPKIDNSNLWDKTYNLLKEKIVQRQFRGNQKLLIPQLAEQLGVSRTPVRDALNRLEMEGLVTTVSKVGTFVKAVEISDVYDIMDTRLMLEFWVADKLAALPKERLHQELKAMERIVSHSRDDLEKLPLSEYLQRDYNLAFHLEFMKLGGNEKNISMYKSLMNYRFLAANRALISKEMVIAAINQHAKIIEGLKTGEPEQMKEEIQKHLDDSKNALMKKMEESGGVL